MLLLISPAKTLDFESPAPTGHFTQADFLADSSFLIDELRALSPQAISSLMGISDKLGTLNYDRFASWQMPFSPINAKQAIFAFQGDVYTGMQADTFSDTDLLFAQRHLRVLSGLYGLLRPLDLIQPYRLEMGTAFANKRGKNLYEFWGCRITDAINQQLEQLDSAKVINLASQEYFGAVKPKQLHADIITPVFKDKKNGTYKIISFFAKKARGMMSAYAIRNRVTEPEALKAFNLGGYAYNPALSRGQEWVYTRDKEA
jgi:uncharacterized protein